MTRRIDRALDLAGLPALVRSAWVEVDVERLTANGAALARLAHPAALGVVVKADGYGHGLEMAARCAVAGGATWLCVADSAEAVRLREDGYTGRALVLYPIPASQHGPMARLGVDVSVGSVDQALDMARMPDEDGPLGVHLEIDTGMTRGGVAGEAVVDAAAALRRGPARLAGTWTHLAAPEDPATTREQLDRFDRTRRRLAEAGFDAGEVHAVASGGLLAGSHQGHDLVRVGLAFYGAHPGAGEPLPAGVGPALAVKAHPVRVAEASAGTSVGYAGTWTADRDSRIATLPLGYADGWSRSSAPGTSALVEERRAPLVGRISSDSLTVDVTDIPGVGTESEFTLLGRDGPAQIDADEVARARGTISWEVLQQLGSRLTRVYTSGDAVIAIRPESSTELITSPSAVLPGY
jgi:alanine racemase